MIKNEELFIQELNGIADKYRNLGYIFNPLINLPIKGTNLMGEKFFDKFPEECDIPKDMQEEIRTLWGKAFG